MSDKPQPQTDEEWKLHSINIHGYFLEKWCREQIATSANWQNKTNSYPVASLSGKQSNLDIWATHAEGDKTQLNCLIECKKNNPEFIDWIFFPKNLKWNKSYVPSVRKLGRTARPSGGSGWSIEASNVDIGVITIGTEEAREVRGSYAGLKAGDKTKTSNAAISEAAYQVALATQAIVRQTTLHETTLGNMGARDVAQPYQQTIFVPIIVTTAQLYVCEFSAKEVDAGTGEIEFDKAQLHPHDYLTFEYPIPVELQEIPANLNSIAHELGDAEEFEQKYMRMDILVVNSQAFPELLTILASSYH